MNLSEAQGFAESQKIAAIRKVYQKGVMNPMINVEQFWKDYCAFENVRLLFDGKIISSFKLKFLN